MATRLTTRLHEGLRVEVHLCWGFVGVVEPELLLLLSDVCSQLPGAQSNPASAVQPVQHALHSPCKLQAV